MHKVCAGIKDLPPFIRDEVLDVCREEMRQEIESHVREEYGMAKMRAVLPDIVSDMVTSRRCGLEMSDHLDNNPGIDKILLDHVMLAIELTIEATSCASYPQEYSDPYGSEMSSESDDY